MVEQGFNFSELVTIARLLSKEIDFSVLICDDDSSDDLDLVLKSEHCYDCISGFIEILRLIYSHRPLPF